MKGCPASWNVRDSHMMNTLERLMKFYGTDSKCIVWAHNTHIGDARATDMRRAKMVNLGQLARERAGSDNVTLVGFGTYEGTVIAAKEWGGRMERCRYRLQLTKDGIACYTKDVLPSSHQVVNSLFFLRRKEQCLLSLWNREQ